ncbi:MAG: TonB-dependent receptor [Bacteroidota bacterium]
MKITIPLCFGSKLQKVGLLALLSLFFTSSLLAQRTINGTIVGEDETPLIGASVFVEGTSTGTVTDIDGNFSLQVADDASTLVVSYTGYQTLSVPLTASNSYDITLLEGVAIEEIVVTGYTVDQRRKISGSVSTIKAEDLKAIPSGNVEQQLQGRVPGVTVVTNGQPGTTSQVRVRGYGALGGNQPLYIVDGVPVGSTDFLSPDDIETTTVLKDATSASLYGARAAGGVIVYTTKRGKRDGRLNVTYDGVFGVTTPGEGIVNLNPQEQAEWTWNAIRNAATQRGEAPIFDHPQYGSGTTPVIPDFLLVGSEAGVIGSVNLDEQEQFYNVDPEAGSIYQVIRANKEGTDWYDEITRNAFLQRHGLGFSGGGESNRYYVGLGYQGQEGNVIGQRLDRYTLRLNTEFDLLPSLRVGENIQVTYRAAQGIQGGGGGAGSSDDENIINMAYRMSPIIPVFDEFGGYAGTAAPGFNNPENPVATIDGNANDRPFATEAFGNLYLEFEPISDLVLRTSFGGRYSNFNFYGFTRRTYENSENNSSFGYFQSSVWSREWVWTNTANYKKRFGGSTIDLLVGQEALNIGTFRNMSGSGINPFSQNPDFVSLSTINGPVLNGNHSNGINFSSYFGRLNYDLNDKYIISALVRRDGSSRFGEATRNGVFPAFSAAWRVSSEPFMQGVSFIDDLKIRGGYGIMGNSNNVAPDNQFSLFGTSLGASSYDIGGTNGSAAQGFFRSRIGNPNAQWESAVTSNVGIDVLLFGGKIDLGVEVWQKDTRDLLFRVPVTVQTGTFANAPSVNVGEMRNRGIDFLLTYKDKSGDFGYEVTVNGGFLNNEIVSLAPDVEDLPNRSSSYRGITPVLNRVGQPLSNFFGFQVVGLFENQAAVDAAPDQEGAAPGRFQFADLNGFDEDGELTGVPDGKIDLADRTDLGSPIPDFTGGITVKLDYRNFDLQMYAFASIGNEIYNVSKLFTDFYPLFPGAAISARVKDSWTPDNLGAEIPIFENTSNFSTNTQSNSFYVEDGSYFRMQNITIGYNIPANTLNSWGMSKIRIFASVNNVFTITGYEGLDPSVGGLADTNFGIDLGNFPITRSWNVGVNLGF